MKCKIVKTFFLDWIFPILIAVICAFIINKFILYKAYSPTGSMIPTLMENEQIIILRVYNPTHLKRGDIVVFDSSELHERLIKRLIGLPGDHIEIRNGIVYINGFKYEEPYVQNPMNTNQIFNVPQGKYFFLGDNRQISYDSRLWKNPYIDHKDIQGKAVLKIYPFNKFGYLH